MCARRRSNFLSLRRKKVTKERATPLSASPALRYGATCGARVQRGLARTRFAQTIASPDPLAAALLGAYRGDGQPNSHSGHCFARPFVVGASALRRAQRMLGRAQRWPVWMSDSRVPFTMRRGAQGVGRHARRSARASCSDSLRLFERSAQRVASSAARPTHEHHRLPAAKRRDAACRVALSLVTFFRRRCTDRTHG